MKRLLTVFVVLMLVSPVVAQDEAPAPAATTTAGQVDLMDDLWMFQDAVPLETGRVDLRFTFGWQTGAKPGGLGDSFQLLPALHWGVADNLELNVKTLVWLTWAITTDLIITFSP